MKVVAYIPIKTNNQRTPGKNTRELCDGTPLCKLSFDAASAVKELDEIYCFCSDESLRDYLSGRVKFLKRSSVLDGPEIRANDLNQAFMDAVDADIYVIIHATGPFLKPETISECINAVKSGEYDSAATVSVVREFLWGEGGPLNFDPSNIMRTQDMKKIVRETTALYVFRKEISRELHRSIGLKPYFKEVGAIESLDLDYPEDFEIIDAVYAKRTEELKN